VGWIDPSPFGPIDEHIRTRARACVAEGTCGMKDIDFAPLLPQGMAMFDFVSTLQAPQVYAEHEVELREAGDAMQPEVRTRMLAGANVPAWRYVRALREREAFTARVERLFEKFDILAMPTVPMTAPEVGERGPLVDGRPVEVRSSLLSLTCPWNLTGMPAISVPAGTIAGLPFGVQLVARAGHEAALLEMAATVARAARRLA
jgi:aspartyl-tRNA(Asn)/glutamyl-tRNA(Gln) amidotransferase subunit A